MKIMDTIFVNIYHCGGPRGTVLLFLISDCCVYKLKDINDSDRTCQNQEQALSYEGVNVIMYVSEEK